MTVAEGLISTGVAETALVVGAEKMSAIIDWTGPRDVRAVRRWRGRGRAAAQRRTGRREFSRTFMRSDGTLADLLYRPAGGATIPMSPAVLDDAHASRADGGPRSVQARRALDGRSRGSRARRRASSRGNDIDLLIPHQANVRIIEATAKHASIPMDKVYVNVDRYGNTSSASIPIALDEAIEKGLVERRIDRADGRVRRRLHLGVDDRSLLALHGRRSALSRSGIAEAGDGKGSRGRVSRGARTSSQQADEALGVALSRALLRGPGRRAHAHAQRAARAARARRRRVGGRSRDRVRPHVRRRGRSFARRVHRVSRGGIAFTLSGCAAPRAPARRADVRERRDSGPARWPRSSATLDGIDRGSCATRAREAAIVVPANYNTPGAARDLAARSPASSARWSSRRSTARSARSG